VRGLGQHVAVIVERQQRREQAHGREREVSARERVEQDRKPPGGGLDAAVGGVFGEVQDLREDRLGDINDALRDPGIRAIFATRGGKGAYRIADGLDFDVAVQTPSP
jgi:hypothetical protein